ncbi:hypothetical protein [Nocardioides ultimimeridianus]
MYSIHELASLLGVSHDAVIAEAATRAHVGVGSGVRVSHKVAEAIATALGKSL